MGKIFGFHLDYLGFDRKSNANKKGLKIELIGLDFFGLYRVHPVQKGDENSKFLLHFEY